MVVEVPTHPSEAASLHASKRHKERHPLKQEAITLQREASSARRFIRAEVPPESIEAAHSHLLKEQQRLAAELAAGNWEAALVTAETLRYLSVPDAQTLQNAIEHYQSQLDRTDELHNQHFFDRKQWRGTRNPFDEVTQQLRWVAYRSAPNRQALDLLIALLEKRVADQEEQRRTQAKQDRTRWEQMSPVVRKAVRLVAVFGVGLSMVSAAQETNAQDLQPACDTAQEAQALLVRDLNNLNNPDQVTSALADVMVQCEAFRELDLPGLFNAAILMDPQAEIVGWDENGPAMSLGAVGEFDAVSVAFEEDGSRPVMIGPFEDTFYYQVNFVRGEERGYGYLAAPELMEHAPDRFYVQARSAGSNIRSGPGTEFVSLAQTEQDQSFLLMGEMPQSQTEWAEVLLADGRTGFIRADQLEPAPLTETEIINQMPVVVRTSDGQTHTTRLSVSNLREAGLNPLVVQAGFDGLRTLALPDAVANPANLQFVVSVNGAWPTNTADQETLIRSSLADDTLINELMVEVITDRIRNEAGNLIVIMTRDSESVPQDATVADIRANYIEAYAYIGVGQLIDRVFEFNATLRQGYEFSERASFEQNHDFSLVFQRDANGVRRLNVVVDGTMVGAILLDNFSRTGVYDSSTLVLAEPGAGNLLAENPIVMSPTAEPTAVPTQVEPTPFPTEVGGVQLVSVGNVSVLENQTEIGNSLEAIQVAWPLSIENVTGTYFLPCAVSEIVLNSEINDGEGRHITPELESMLDVRCRYLAADGSEQEVLIPMSFVLTRNGEPQSFHWGGAPADFRFFPNNAREWWVDIIGLRVGDVLAVRFNMDSYFGYGEAQGLWPQIAQVMDQATLDEFAQTGQASLLGGNFIPLDVGIGAYPYPERIEL